MVVRLIEDQLNSGDHAASRHIHSRNLQVTAGTQIVELDEWPETALAPGGCQVPDSIGGRSRTLDHAQPRQQRHLAEELAGPREGCLMVWIIEHVFGHSRKQLLARLQYRVSDSEGFRVIRCG